eukprot:Pgem_evm1s18163
MHRNRNQLRSRTDPVTKPATWSNKAWNALSKYEKAFFGDAGGEQAENILNLKPNTGQKIKNMWERLTPEEQFEFIYDKNALKSFNLYPNKF